MRTYPYPNCNQWIKSHNGLPAEPVELAHCCLARFVVLQMASHPAAHLANVVRVSVETFWNCFRNHVVLNSLKILIERRYPTPHETSSSHQSCRIKFMRTYPYPNCNQSIKSHNGLPAEPVELAHCCLARFVVLQMASHPAAHLAQHRVFLSQ